MSRLLLKAAPQIVALGLLNAVTFVTFYVWFSHSEHYYLPAVSW